MEIKRVRRDPYVAMRADQLPKGVPAFDKDKARDLAPPGYGGESEEATERYKKRIAAYKHGEELLIEAVLNGKLANLEQFTWEFSPPLYCARAHLFYKGHDIWTALAKGCPKLRHVKVWDDCEFHHFAGPDALPKNEDGVDTYEHLIPIHQSTIWQALRNIRTFDYYTESTTHGADVEMKPLVEFIAANEQLEKLKLAFSLAGGSGRQHHSASLDPLFSISPLPHLPSLRHLEFCGVRASPANAMTFLTKVAPNLVDFRSWHEGGLNTDEDDFGQHDESESMLLPADALPNIKVFGVFGMEKTWAGLAAAGKVEPPEHY